MKNIRGYHLNEIIGYEMATVSYRGQTEELWLPAETRFQLFPLPETFSMQARMHFLCRFSYEARRLIQLRHDALFPLFGYGEEDNVAYLLTPPQEGETLAAQMQQKRLWSPLEALTLLTPIADALEMLHQQELIYQFLHPGLILVSEEQRPQITCLRLAQMVCLHGLHPTSYTKHLSHLQAFDGSYLGRAEYLAPEVIKGEKADARSDIYSLGAILFELLSGQPLFSGSDYLAIARKHLSGMFPSLHEIRPEIPIGLENVINHALHLDPRYRFQTVSEFMSSYATVINAHPLSLSTSLFAWLIARKQELPVPTKLTYLVLPSPTLEQEEGGERASEDEAPPSSPEEMAVESWLNSQESSPVSKSAPSKTLEHPVVKELLSAQALPQKETGLLSSAQTDPEILIDSTLTPSTQTFHAQGGGDRPEGIREQKTEDIPASII